MTDLRRRRFLKLAGAAAAAAVTGPWWGSGCARSSGRRPNIVFILTDDHRHDALGCSGHPFLQTPNLDRLATEGVRFTNAFVTTSLCSPSRASFLTGCYAHTHGVTANEQQDPPPELPTFPALLQTAGYETAFVGKWHQARWSSPRPGFDHWGSFSGQGDYRRNTLNVDGEFILSERYLTDELTDYAVRFLRRERDRPFLLCLSHKAAHEPFLPAARHAGLYAGAPLGSREDPRDRLADKPDWGGRQAAAGRTEQLRDYFRTLAAVDESTGSILAALAAEGQLDDTVLVYAGDNGFHHGEHGGLWDKRTAYEDSLRIPVLMRYPGLVRAGTTCGEMILNVDLAPTLLELAGLAAPVAMQGRSWLGPLAGGPGRESFLYEYRPGTGPVTAGQVPAILAVRTRDWKYIHYPDLAGLNEELYDLQQDPGELFNLAPAPEHAADLDRLRAELKRLREETA